MGPPPIYPPADHTIQWFADTHPGSTWDKVDRLVLHTTEGTGWPSYDGGAIAPNWTGMPDPSARRVRWRQHYPAGMSSRALVNAPGGVETNRAHAVQVELVGTCIPGNPGVCWPQAPDWALQAVAGLAGWLHTEWGLELAAAPLWLPYKDSTDRQRMSGDEWDAFRGVCGHEHVPENNHKDPADFPAGRVLTMAGDTTMPTADEIAHTLATSSEFLGAVASKVWTVGWPAPTPDDPHHIEAAQDRLVQAARGSALTGSIDRIVGMLTTGVPMDLSNNTVTQLVDGLAAALTPHLTAGSDPHAVAVEVASVLADKLAKP